MSGLAALMAKQKEAQRAKANIASTPAAEPVVVADDSNGRVGTPSPSPAKLKFGIKKLATAGKPATESIQEPTQVSQVDSKQESIEKPITLDDILDEDGTLAPIDDSPRGAFAFSDEIPSTAPIRELPEDMDKTMKAFVVQLDSVYEVVHDPELSGQMIRTIMQELQEHPDYIRLIADQDVHTMIRSLRDSMGLARVKKAEKSTRAKGGKAAPKTSAVAGTLDEMFNSDDW